MYPKESANRKPGEVPQGHTPLSLTGRLQDGGGGVCKVPERDEQEDSNAQLHFPEKIKIHSLNVFQIFSSPDGVNWPVGLHRCWHRRAGAHQHGTVDVSCNYQDAEEDWTNDGALQTQIVGTPCHCQACQIWVSTPET